MKASHFQVSDKVVLKPDMVDMVATVPKLVPGRVYCVERINVVYGNLWLRLVGVREHRIKCADDRGSMALAFRHVGTAGNEAKKGGH